MKNPFRYFKTSPEIIRLAVMMYVRFPLSLRNVEDLLHERGIDISHEAVRCWWNRFGLMFAAEIRKKRVQQRRAYSTWRWHLDEVFVKINDERYYLWRAVDHEGEVLETYVTKRRDRPAARKGRHEGRASQLGEVTQVCQPCDSRGGDGGRQRLHDNGHDDSKDQGGGQRREGR